jgi:hypothetical protein
MLQCCSKRPRLIFLPRYFDILSIQVRFDMCLRFRVESREVEEEPLPASQQQRQVDEAPPIATLSSEHARFYRAAAGAHAAGWAAEHFEAQVSKRLTPSCWSNYLLHFCYAFLVRRA